MKYIGIDLGGTNIAVGIVDENGAVLQKKSVPTPVKEGADAVVAAMADAVKALLLASGTALAEIGSIGIGSPGAVDPKAGVVLSACNLGFSNEPLVSKLRARIDKPVFLENDANCAAWAEACAGAAKGLRHSLTVTLGTGVGGGIVIDGKLYGGFNSFGGEFGHMVIAYDGEPCPCGRRGCFEVYASATGLIRQTRRAAEQNKASLLWSVAEKEGKFSGRTAFAAARLGDKSAITVVDTYIKYLATGLSDLVKIFQPEMIVLGGGVSHEGDALLLPLSRAVDEMSYGKNVPAEKKTRLARAMLGNDAGIVGAALLKG